MCVLVGSGCHNKISYTGGLKNKNLILTVMEDNSRDKELSPDQDATMAGVW